MNFCEGSEMAMAALLLHILNVIFVKTLNMPIKYGLCITHTLHLLIATSSYCGFAEGQQNHNINSSL